MNFCGLWTAVDIAFTTNESKHVGCLVYECIRAGERNTCQPKRIKETSIHENRTSQKLVYILLLMMIMIMMTTMVAAFPSCLHEIILILSSHMYWGLRLQFWFLTKSL
jgi:uncharacterized membrane protein